MSTYLAALIVGAFVAVTVAAVAMAYDRRPERGER